VGAGPAKIVALLMFESGLLSLVGALLGVLLVYGLLLVSQPLIERQFGLFIPIQALTPTAYLYLSIEVELTGRGCNSLTDAPL
jgi:putative ABC transport system permease protein